MKYIFTLIVVVVVGLIYANNQLIQEQYESWFLLPDNFDAVSFSEKETICQDENLVKTIKCARVRHARTLAQPVIDSGILDTLELHDIDASNLKVEPLDFSNFKIEPKK